MAKTIDIEMVRHIALLSRIELSEQEARAMGTQLGDILGYFDKLQELDTSGAEPMAHALEGRNVLGEDVPGESLSAEEALANAPQRDGDFFKVPKVIGEGQ